VPHPVVPRQLRLAPFVGADAVAAGLLTKRQPARLDLAYPGKKVGIEYDGQLV
jgi:hypothetical protein